MTGLFVRPFIPSKYVGYPDFAILDQTAAAHSIRIAYVNDFDKVAKASFVPSEYVG